MCSESDVVLNVIGEALSGISGSNFRIVAIHKQSFSLPAPPHGWVMVKCATRVDVCALLRATSDLNLKTPKLSGLSANQSVRRVQKPSKAAKFRPTAGIHILNRTSWMLLRSI